MELGPWTICQQQLATLAHILHRYRTYSPTLFITPPEVKQETAEIVQQTM